jgi:hypothetical protein
MKSHILDDAVSLVEDAEHSGALRHRRHPTLAVRRRRDLPSIGQRRIPVGLPLAARGKRKRCKQRCGTRFHAYSGIQGS